MKTLLGKPNQRRKVLCLFLLLSLIVNLPAIGPAFSKKRIVSPAVKPSLTLQTLDVNGDNRVSPWEFGGSGLNFKQFDSNGDGVLSGAELLLPIKGDGTALADGKQPTGVITSDSLVMNIWIEDKVFPGTTLFPNLADEKHPKVTEVDLSGNVVWEYVLPDVYKQHIHPGFDAKPLANGNVLIALPGKGILEIDRSGRIVWKHVDNKISHDVDRLPNGNTLYVFGDNDKEKDFQVKEITPDGKLVWAWSVSQVLDTLPHDPKYIHGGLTHANAVSRLENGNTLVSLRNFQYLVEVSPKGEVVKTLGKDLVFSPHDPAILDNGHILVSSHYPLIGQPNEPLGKARSLETSLIPDTSVTLAACVEINPVTSKIVWKFDSKKWLAEQRINRDCDRLPNGNTLIVGTTKMIEISPDGGVVWMLSAPWATGPKGAFYKAYRIPLPTPDK